MTPKEKAHELFEKMALHICNTDAQECALVAIDEILNSTPLHPNDVDWDDCGAAHNYYYYAQKEEAKKYWQEVKKELEQILEDGFSRV